MPPSDPLSHPRDPTFHPFARLPGEVRKTIWILAFNPFQPRLHALHLIRARYNSDPPPEPRADPLLRRSTAPLRKMLRTCRESRQLALLAAPDTLHLDDSRDADQAPNQGGGPVVRFDGARDLLFLRVYPWEAGVLVTGNSLPPSRPYRLGLLITRWGRWNDSVRAVLEDVGQEIPDEIRRRLPPRAHFTLPLERSEAALEERERRSPPREWRVIREHGVWNMPIHG